MGSLKELFLSSVAYEELIGEPSVHYAENNYFPQFVVTEALQEDGKIILSAHVGVRTGEENKIPEIKEKIWQKMRETFERKEMQVQNYGETRLRACYIQKEDQKFSQQIMHIFIDPNPPK